MARRPSASEWVRGVTNDGVTLPDQLCEVYRERLRAAGLTLSMDAGTINRTNTIEFRDTEKPVDPGYGPGYELKTLLAGLNVNSDDACGCTHRASVMNKWGPSRCRENRERIVGWLREASEKTEWLTSLRAGWAAVASGLVLQMDWADPLGWLVDESIKRAEERGQR